MRANLVSRFEKISKHLRLGAQVFAKDNSTRRKIPWLSQRPENTRSDLRKQGITSSAHEHEF
jgi:hypothetical protein